MRQPGKVTTTQGTIPDGVTALRITADMLLADLQDPTKTLTYGIEKSTDGGNTWRLLVQSVWMGGTPNRDGQYLPPIVGITVHGGELIRGQLTVSEQMRVGAIVESV